MDLDAAVAQAHRRYADAHPRSRALHERAAQVLPGGNTRSVLHIDPFAFRVERADGAWLHDVDGHRYLDVLGDYSAGLLGHRPPAIAAAVRGRLDTGWALGGMTGSEIEFAEAVVDRFASIEQVRFTNSGTEANLMALMTARHATGRSLVIVFAGGYHGGVLYYGAAGVGVRAPFDHLVLPYNDVDAFRDMMATRGRDVACVLVEPMLGATGCIPASQTFLDALRDGTHDAGAVLVFDEVMTSRLAPGGAQQLTGVVPDMTTLGKYMAGGMTFGAFGGRRDLMAAFDPATGELVHAGTFNNNGFTMAAGVATQRLVLAGGFLAALAARGDDLRARLTSVFDASSLPFSTSGWGSLSAIHPVPGPVRTAADLDDADPRWRQLLFHDLLAAGFYISPRGYMALSAELDDTDIEAFVDAVAQFCERYAALA